MKDAQLDAANARLAAPDIPDAQWLQKRLQAKDHRLEVFWGSNPGPHFKRWVVARNAEDGQRHIVKVFQNQHGEYERPEPSFADNLMDVSGRAGDDFLKRIEREEERSRQHRADAQEEFIQDLGERMASDLRNAAGVTDSIVVPGGVS